MKLTKCVAVIGCLFMAGTVLAQPAREIQQALRLRSEAFFLEEEGKLSEALGKYRESLALADDAALREKISELERRLVTEPPVARLIKRLELEQAYIDAISVTLVQMLTLFPEMREYEDILIEYAEERLDWGALQPIIAGWYEEMFTEEEILALIQFHESPVGQKWVRNLPRFSVRMETLVRDRFQADLELLELRMKNRELDRLLEASVFADGVPAPRAPSRE